MPNTTKAGHANRKAALKAACLTAGLVTAFAASPAHATVVASQGVTAVNGDQVTQIYDAYVLNASPYVGTSAVESPLDSTPPVSTINDGNSSIFEDSVTEVPSTMISPLGSTDTMVVYADSADNIGGQSFESEFLTTDEDDFGPFQNGGSYTEGQVVNYIQYSSLGETDPNASDEDAYNQFLDNLYYDDYNAGVGTGTINAYEFTNGQFIGTVNTGQLPPGSSPYTGFGLTPSTAVPEPGPLPLLLLGGAALLGITATRRRKTVSNSK